MAVGRGQPADGQGTRFAGAGPQRTCGDDQTVIPTSINMPNYQLNGGRLLVDRDGEVLDFAVNRPT